MIFQNFKKSEDKYFNLANTIWFAHENYFWQLYKNPTSINDFMNYIKTCSNSDNIADIPNLIKKNGIFLDCDSEKDIFCIYTANHRNIKKFSNNKYYNIKNVNFYTFLFKDIKIYIYKTKLLKLCSVNKKKVNLINNNKHINNKSNLYYQVYQEIKKLNFQNKRFLSTKVYLYGVKQNNKFNFLILCKNNYADYNDILVKTDSIFNSANFKDSIDEVFLPIRELADTSSVK